MHLKGISPIIANSHGEFSVFNTITHAKHQLFNTHSHAGAIWSTANQVMLYESSFLLKFV